MARLSDLANVLIESRVTTRERWEEITRAGGGDLARILAALAEEPPSWWDGTHPPPPGLTEYQQSAIRARLAAGELDALRRDLALNHFLLLDKLGQGGQGAVYRGRQLNPPRFAAVKTLIRDTETRRRRFEQEARTMMKVRHPAVARFYLYERVRDAAGGPTDEYLIAMELVSGTDLNRFIRLNGPVPWQFAVRWVVDLLGGLAAIHRHGFVHRDVKPENIMVIGPPIGPDTLPEETAVKLLDFGAVKQVGAEEEEDAAGTRTFLGTMEYAPPEQWKGSVVAASDIYALGGTSYYMLTGRTPYQKTRRDPVLYRHAHTREEVPDVRDLNPDVPEGVSCVFQRMMAKDALDRGTAAELVEELRTFLPQPSEPAQQQKPPPTPPTRTRPATARTSKAINSSPKAELQNPTGRVLDSVLSLLERIFIPRHLRPPPGETPVPHERLVALLRRPLVLIILAISLALLILWVL